MQQLKKMLEIKTLDDFDIVGWICIQITKSLYEKYLDNAKVNDEHFIWKFRDNY